MVYTQTDSLDTFTECQKHPKKQCRQPHRSFERLDRKYKQIIYYTKYVNTQTAMYVARQTCLYTQSTTDNPLTRQTVYTTWQPDRNLDGQRDSLDTSSGSNDTMKNSLDTLIDSNDTNTNSWDRQTDNFNNQTDLYTSNFSRPKGRYRLLNVFCGTAPRQPWTWCSRVWEKILAAQTTAAPEPNQHLNAAVQAKRPSK